MAAKTVEDILGDDTEQVEILKSLTVRKDLDVDIDSGNLLLCDPNATNLQRMRNDGDTYLKELSRDNTQLLIARLFQLPCVQQDYVVTAKLPEGTTVLPREKPLSAKKESSKWEKYANLKGITKKKKSRKIWDDEKKDFVPRWGFKRGNDSTKNWVVEVPDNAADNEDQFEKLSKAKRERESRNELMRLRNLARNSKKGRFAGVGITPMEVERPNTDSTKRALDSATKSTASLGRFTNKLKDEQQHTKGVRGRKRHFLPNEVSGRDEKKRQTAVLKAIESKKPLLDVNKAVNHHIHEQNEARHRANEEAAKNPIKRSTKGGKNRRGGGPGFKKGARRASTKVDSRKGANKRKAGKGVKRGNKRQGR